MRRMTWRIWKLFGRSRRLHVRGKQARTSDNIAEVLEPRTLPTAEVSGIAFIDADTDGTRDANEILIRGVPISLTGQTTDGVNVKYTTKTDDDGAYEFPDVLPGTYSLSAGTTQNVTGTTPDINDFPVEDGETITQNLPFSGEITASALSLRQFLTTAPLVTSITEVFAPAAERENSLPEFQEGNEEINVGKNDTETIVDLAGLFTDSDYTNSQVKIKTSMGDFNVELFDEQTPQTVANFFNYVKEDRYDNTFFHRLVSGFVLQGGGFAFDDTANTIEHIEADPPVENEFSVARSNIRGTIAMAKVGGDPNSATSEFFINLGNNAANLDNQNGGFTVFGKLVAAADQTVVDTLAATTIRDQSTTNGALNEVPLKNYSGPNDDPNFLTAAATSNFVTINDIEIVKQDEFLTYELVSNSNTELVTASITNNRLTLEHTAGMTGEAEITIRVTDKVGAYIETTFNVVIENEPPEVTSLTLTPADPTTVDMLTATAVKADDDDAQNEIQLTYVWKRIVGTDESVLATHGPTTDTTDDLDLTQFTVDPGDEIRVEVTPIDDDDLTGETATASKTLSAVM